MIKQIQEINFPSYATLSSATVTLNDMGDKTISAQVKIDGSVVPDFSYDWEVEFKGERYIQPLRQPQASKGNESICSVIDLVFQHKTIYDLKRYFFVEMASTTAGTAIADKYIASLAVNLKDFCVNFQNVLDYYFNGEITINLNPDWVYAEETSFVEINYSHIWDVLLKIHEVYGVRWHIEGNTIFIGYPTEEVAHIFEYGFEGGLLKVERQVQSADICNSLLGRGGEKNLPYRYFKDASKDAQGNEWKADPDWIPELASVNFTNLRGKTFRDYVKGWKAKHYGGEVMAEPTEAYTKGYTDEKFNPVESVEDKESIEKYGLLQGGLENQEDIYPSIQGVEVEPYGRIDQIVGAEQVIIDEATSDYTPKSVTMSIDDTFTGDQIEATNVENEYILHSDTIHQFNEGSVGYILSNPLFKATVQQYYLEPFSGLTFTIPEDRDIELISYKVIDADTNEYVNNIIAIPNSLKFKIEYRVKADIGNKGVKIISRAITSNWSMSSRPFAGEILENLNTDGTRKSVTIAVPSKETKSVTIQSDTFTIPEDGATNIDVPVSINTDLEGEGLYEWKRDIEAVNTETNEVVTSINIPQGTYYLRVKVEITNNSDSAYDYKVELLPSYILYPTDSEEFKPTFDIWVKNIWNTSRNAGESDQAYADRVWLPILGDREGNEPKVVFTTGRLAGHSDWEFKIYDFAYAGGEGVEYNGVKAEWRLTLVKSEAEIEATGKWIPSTMQQASVGDHFFFIGIDMPHQYILWAEERLDDYKRDKILDTANIKPTWVVQTDKVRLNQDENGATLLDSFKTGNSILLADTRFIEGEYERLYLQSITYSWDAQTILYPNVEVVLADKPITTSNPVAKIQGDIESLNRSAVKTSDVQNLILTIGDKIYLRKDGLSQASNSPTTFNQQINSAGYRQGAFGGRGWGLRNDGEKGVLEVDKLVVRDELQVNTIVSNQIEAIGGKQIESAARITCTKVEDIDGGYKCYFDQKQGSIVNLFKVNDIALSQVFSPDNSEVKHYKRVVEAVDNNSITLSKTQVDGEGMPQEGDVIVHFGNTTDPNRQYVIIRDVIGGGYERMLSDLNSVSASGVEYYFAGRMDGSTPRWFVGNNNQFIEYKNGHLQINADVTIGANSNLSASQEFQDVKNTAQGAQDYIDNTLPEELQKLQDQIDGKKEEYYYDYDPTLDNYPASEWTTEKLKEEHLYDTFTNISTGDSWRWLLQDGSYQWVLQADTVAQEALLLARDAMGVAQGKRTIFVVQPTPPYQVGDLWVQGTSGRTMRCVKARSEGAYTASDWDYADDSHEYTDGEIAKYKKSVDATVVSLNNAIADAETNANAYTDEGKAALQTSINELNNAKANINDVYTKAEADGKIDQAEADAIASAEELANAAQALAEETAKAYADGVVDAEEEARITQAQENLNAAKEYAEDKAKEAEDNAKQYTDTQVSTIDYLKQAFPSGAILDVNGVTLAALMGVKDANEVLKAGLYGGASSVLNDAGYKDSTHGTMLVFGGIEGASQPDTYKTAIFEDGYIESEYFATARTGARVEMFDNQVKIFGSDGSTHILMGWSAETGNPELQYVDANGARPWLITSQGISNAVTLNTEQKILAVKDFDKGLKIGGLSIYKSQDDTIYLDGNLVVRGGITAFGTNETITASIFEALPIDGATLKRTENGVLYVDTTVVGGGGGTGGGIDEEELEAYLTDNKYITQDWVEAKNYALKSEVETVSTKLNNFLEGSDTDDIINKWSELEVFLSGLSESDDLATILSTKFDTSNFNRDNVKTILGIADWALASTKPSYNFSDIGSKPTTLSGYGITNAYTKTEADGKYLRKSGGTISNTITAPLVVENTSGAEVAIRFLNKNNTEYGGYLVWSDSKWKVTDDGWDISWELLNEGNYTTWAMSKSVAQKVSAVHNFENGIKLFGKSPFSYNASKDTWELDGNLVITKGLATYTRLEGFEDLDITMAISVDGDTISNEGGILHVVGGTGGDIDEDAVNALIDEALVGYATQSWVTNQGYLTSHQSLAGYAKESWVESQGYALGSTQITAGTGLKGGGTLAANRTLSLATIGTAGTYTKVTTDAYGRVKSGTTLSASDIPSLPWSKITSGKPTTLSGYGITNAYTKTEADERYLKLTGGELSGDISLPYGNRLISPSGNIAGTRIFGNDTVNYRTLLGTASLNTLLVGNDTLKFWKGTIGQEYEIIDTSMPSISFPKYIATGIGTFEQSGYKVKGNGVDATFGANDATGGAYLWVASYHALRFATNSAERMRITKDGNVAIGGTTADAKLHVHGNLLATGGITAQNSSDRRLKRNLRRFNASEVLMSLGGVYRYEYIESEVEKNDIYRGSHFGLIYQNVRNTALDVMCIEREDGYGSLNYLHPSFISLLAAVGIEHETKLSDHEKRIKELEDMIVNKNK